MDNIHWSNPCTLSMDITHTIHRSMAQWLMVHRIIQRILFLISDCWSRLRSRVSACQSRLQLPMGNRIRQLVARRGGGRGHQLSLLRHICWSEGLVIKENQLSWFGIHTNMKIKKSNSCTLLNTFEENNSSEVNHIVMTCLTFFSFRGLPPGSADGNFRK